jgi:hypothetical protein
MSDRGFKPLVHSSRPLMNSSQGLTRTSQEYAEKTAFATERARLLLGQFRRGEANDPETFITSVAAVFSRYPEATVISVTDPRTGLATKKDWLPTIREIVDECELLEAPNRRAAERKRVAEQTLKNLTEFEARGKTKPTFEQLEEKYGPDWGLTGSGKLEELRGEYVSEAEQRVISTDKAVAESHRLILAEYRHRGVDPVYAGDMPVSFGLVKLLRPNYRRPGVGTEPPEAA